VVCCGARVCTCFTPLEEILGGWDEVFREDALVRALCPGALRAGLLRAAWRTALLCAWRWQKAGGFLPHSSFVFSKRKLQKLCVGRWGGLSPVSL